MKLRHFSLLVVSVVVALCLLAGGLVVNVGASEGSYRQAVLFAEVLSLVLENYVDPVESEGLLAGAYAGMLTGLDPNGAYLTPEEVRAWRAAPPEVPGDPGFTVLKTGRTLTVVGVDPDSPADDAGLVVGDQLQSIEDRKVKDLSMTQARRMIAGEVGSTVTLVVLRAADGFERELLELHRVAPRSAPYEVQVLEGVAVVRFHTLAGLPVDELAAELDDVESRGVHKLLLDLRNLSDASPRDAAAVAGLFADAGQLRLRDRTGRLVESVETAAGRAPIWSDELSILVNGATAGGAEALALLVRASLGATVFGEKTYGLGAEAQLFELERGDALLVSSSLWETPEGLSWHTSGVMPDETVDGDGEDFAEIARSQLERVLRKMTDEAEAAEPAKAA